MLSLDNLSAQTLFIEKALIEKHLSYDCLIGALREGFTKTVETPLRHHHHWGESQDELLVMPAWDLDVLTVKLATICPDNQQVGLNAISGLLVMFDGKHGQPLAVMDASEITARRTAAASALASSYLSRANSQSLLMVGTGALASHLVQAHLAIRDIREVTVWGRDPAKAESVAVNLDCLLSNQIEVKAADDLQSTVAQSDIISMATRATEPLIVSEWITPGTHLDLVGSYRTDMREVDSETVRRSALFVDTRAGVLAEAGDITEPIRESVIEQDHIQAELSELCAGYHPGRQQDEEITLFKSVGTALEDLVAAKTVYQCVSDALNAQDRK